MTKTISLWRIARETVNYSADDLSGAGAAKTGNRWNHIGTPVVYTASHISLAAIELAVHLGELAVIRDLFLLKVSVPKVVWDAREQLNIGTLKPSWSAVPSGGASKDAGTLWAKRNVSALLEVPSVIVPEETNVLINPTHPDSAKISATVIRQFLFDPRMNK